MPGDHRGRVGGGGRAAGRRRPHARLSGGCGGRPGGGGGARSGVRRRAARQRVHRRVGLPRPALAGGDRGRRRRGASRASPPPRGRSARRGRRRPPSSARGTVPASARSSARRMCPEPIRLSARTSEIRSACSSALFAPAAMRGFAEGRAGGRSKSPIEIPTAIRLRSRSASSASTHGVVVQPGFGQRLAGGCVRAEPRERQQQVLGLDRRASELASFGLRGHDHQPRLACEPLEHQRSLGPTPARQPRFTRAGCISASSRPHHRPSAASRASCARPVA